MNPAQPGDGFGLLNDFGLIEPSRASRIADLLLGLLVYGVSFDHVLPPPDLSTKPHVLETRALHPTR